MHAIGYILALPFLYIISISPFWLLYRLSDFIYFLIYHVFGYRKKVIRKNLQASFPTKTKEELKGIERAFYKHFADFMVEAVKALTISEKTLKKRVTIKDPSIYEKYFNQKQSIIITMGHYGNWELGGLRFSLAPYHQLYVIYRPLANKHFSNLTIKMRTRMGNKLFAMQNILRSLVKHKNELMGIVFISDQTPSPKRAYWVDFLNQETPVYKGTARIAKKFNYPVVYAAVKKVKRGYYHIETDIVAENPAELSEEELTKLHTNRLEKDIVEHPEFWLWTHKRWKHKRSLQP